MTAAFLLDDALRVSVELGERSYNVWVGPGVRHRLAEVVPPGASRVAVVTQAAVADAGITVDPGVEHRVFITDDGEHIKTMGAAEQLCREFAQWGLTRRDAVVAVGGGAVTDLAGFTAAVYHRGIRMVYVATTLLGQIDASVGGKTGVNLPEGKNLVGAFWQPSAVLCDTEALDTLPPEEMRSGLGEMAKYHFIADADLHSLALPERIARCVAIKAEVVAADERESGRRAVLNYGHTLAHALEAHGGYNLRHGEAVAIGLVYAAELARRAGRIDASRVSEHRRVVGGYGLPTSLPAGADPDSLVELFNRDKKAVDGVTFMLDGPNGIQPATGLAPALLRESMEAIR
ncbi:MAG: 3-dehydroquinate synthase [bacterium]|nr:3-dehydroquinate synthase [bacterium]